MDYKITLYSAVGIFFCEETLYEGWHHDYGRGVKYMVQGFFRTDTEILMKGDEVLQRVITTYIMYYPNN